MIQNTISPDIMDAALSKLAEGTRIDLCSAAPSTREEATSTLSLASKSLAPADFTIEDGDTSGRKLVLASQSGITASESGTACCIAITSGSELLAVSKITDSVVVHPGTVGVPSYTLYSIQAPA